jgi:site-specific DNA-cytosine methylase
MKNKILTIISGVIILVVGGILIIDTNNTKKANYEKKEQQINELKYQTTETSTKEETKPTTTTTKKTTTTVNNYKQLQTTKKKKTTKKVATTTKKVIKKTTSKVTNTKGSYKLTHYGWDCKGCGGNTSIGYNVKHTIYYNDKQYGKVRICAMSSAMPLYSIIKIKNYKLGGDITCAVIDRGVGSGVIDLLVESEKKSSQLGIQRNVQIEILRKGK